MTSGILVAKQYGTKKIFESTRWIRSAFQIELGTKTAIVEREYLLSFLSRFPDFRLSLTSSYMHLYRKRIFKLTTRALWSFGVICASALSAATLDSGSIVSSTLWKREIVPLFDQECIK